jgi:ATP-dependent Clp protease ATP-binding subunit ClpB
MSNNNNNNNNEENSNEDPLKTYCIDFTEKAAHSKLDPVIGRENETRLMMQILMRRSKNNPVLLAQPGVG